jgi:K+-transporting ATPase ATPase A chain
MTSNAVLQLAVYLVTLTALAVPLGYFMARVYQGDRTLLGRLLGPVERAFYRLGRVDPAEDMGWKRYTAAVLLFNLAD